mmetsp:Transcript_54260/g.86263  ORF Transcript_54260/g.86263 Transcript_54260/m.86263 type:complete len:116 (+) Transcript_54260:1-348(+)
MKEETKCRTSSIATALGRRTGSRQRSGTLEASAKAAIQQEQNSPDRDDTSTCELIDATTNNDPDAVERWKKKFSWAWQSLVCGCYERRTRPDALRQEGQTKISLAKDTSPELAHE